ncbi:MAG: hypothetical protein C4575_09775 [Desulforudis sp.]|nr:MAG: hypothetical protein C4575_09775 [Desulforudis sp.]
MDLQIAYVAVPLGVVIAIVFAALGVKARREYSSWLNVRRRAHESEEDRRSALQREAMAAGLDIPESHMVIAGVSGAVVGMGLVLAVTGSTTLAPAGLLLGVAVPSAWVKHRVRGRARAFEAQLGIILGQMAASLRAGQSVPQALEQAALSAPPPAQDVFGRAVQLMRVGKTPIEALEEAGKLVKSRDMELISVATAVQMRTGGDLAALYDQSAEGIRDRTAFRSQVSAATSEGRLTTNVLVILPFLAVGGMRVLSPEYMSPLFNAPGGQITLVVCSGLILLGWAVVRRIVAVEY